MLQEIRVRFRPSADGRFDLLLTDAAGNARGVTGDFTPFLADDDYENLRWYLEEYMDLPDASTGHAARPSPQKKEHLARLLKGQL